MAVYCECGEQLVYMGDGRRTWYYCPYCQVKYTEQEMMNLRTPHDEPGGDGRAAGRPGRLPMGGRRGLGR